MATYTVKSGDSLSAIAGAVLGDESRWVDIAVLNDIASPYLIYPGQVLQLPEVIAPRGGARGAPSTIATAGDAGSGKSIFSNRWLWIGGGLLAAAIAVFGGVRSNTKRTNKRRRHGRRRSGR